MNSRQANPGVSREQRISDEGLKRLEKQLLHGSIPSPMVLSQWIKRYGDPARELLRQYGQYSEELEG